MRPRGAVRVLLAGLLTGGLIAAGATPVQARPETPSRKVGPTLTARLAPPVVSVGEPAALVATLGRKQAARPLVVQRRADGAWTPLLEVLGNGTGRTVVALDTTVAGTQVLRVVAPATNARSAVRSRQVSLRVRAATSCAPKPALVDEHATAAARCLAARLDRWRSAGLMGVGQQLNLSNEQYAAPLVALGERRVSVVGFDLWELAKTTTYEYPFFDRAMTDLVALARDGAILSASWHAPNPHTGRDYDDRSWHSLRALRRPASSQAQSFWADFDSQLEVFAALQEAGVAVVFRPFHEVNGDWFWWGRPVPSTFKAVWRDMQDRAWTAGVHNIVWAYSFAANTRAGIATPKKLLPPRVDLAGIDSYYPASGSHRSKTPSMAGYAAVAKRVPRMVITEIGPSASAARTWPASVVTSAARDLPRKPVWAMLWVDDPAGAKQISSLRGGLSWLDSCPNGLCDLG